MEFAEIFRPIVLTAWVIGMMFGVFVGSTPGLTATMAVALIVPMSYKLDDPTAGLAMIIGVSFTAIFAGDIPATLFRIPGTPASAAATLDGYQMTRRGEGGRALSLDLLCSCLGGLVGVIILATIAPQIAQFALRFSDFENFWLAVFGLSLSVIVSRGRLLLGGLAACLGILISTVGSDIRGSQRFVFGEVDWLPEYLRTQLLGGIHFIPLMIGLFGLAEVIKNLREGEANAAGESSSSFRLDFGSAAKLVGSRVRMFLQSSLLGTLIGALPGAGADIAAWAAYGLGQRTSRNGNQFGKGGPDGVIAPTSANNAAVAGAWIPALVFGVPGDAVTAIVVSAFITYNIRPGPAIFEESGEQMRALFLIALLTQILLFPVGYLGICSFGQIMRLPRRFILAGVLVFSVVGAYALRNSMFDVYVMCFFGLVGHVMDRNRAPTAPLILGLILGPLLEERLRDGLIKSQGSIVPFFTRPICLALVIILIVVAVSGRLLAKRSVAQTSKEK